MYQDWYVRWMKWLHLLIPETTKSRKNHGGAQQMLVKSTQNGCWHTTDASVTKMTNSLPNEATQSTTQEGAGAVMQNTTKVQTHVQEEWKMQGNVFCAPKGGGSRLSAQPTPTHTCNKGCVA